MSKQELGGMRHQEARTGRMAPPNLIVRPTLLRLVAILSLTICTDVLFGQSSLLTTSSNFAEDSGQSLEAEMLELRERVRQLEETNANRAPDMFSVSHLPIVGSNQTIHESSQQSCVANTKNTPL